MVMVAAAGSCNLALQMYPCPLDVDDEAEIQGNAYHWA